jgi:hypothetical protein
MRLNTRLVAVLHGIPLLGLIGGFRYAAARVHARAQSITRRRPSGGGGTLVLAMLTFLAT